MIFFCHGVTVNANCGKHHKNHRQNRKGQPHAKDALRGLSERILLPCYKAKCIQNEAGHSCHHTANRLFHKGRESGDHAFAPPACNHFVHIRHIGKDIRRHKPDARKAEIIEYAGEKKEESRR